ncbi:MAG TPA: hypothetical protein VMS09_20430 [Paenibacillus sp.]|uniref:hypothetical protein n=1 Tax=Paenibacillus sp. TaxID=58172 RepID=UPI002C8D8728|nr:hypothetical protein [Paenibacillus sp.]HUC94352.1 hypothetical protein [Paenibacillus sp.]
MKRLLFLAAIAIYLGSAVYPDAALKWAVSALSFAIVVTAFFSAGKFVRAVGGVFLAVGFSLLALNKASAAEMLRSFGYMMNVLSLFALIPLIALPIELGRYAARVQAAVRARVRSSGMLYALTSFLSYVFCSFMNLGALPMVHQTIRPSLKLFPIRERDRFISRAITHGYSMPVIWTPVSPILGIVVEMTGVRWSALLPIVIPLSLLGLALDWAIAMWIAARRRKQAGVSAASELSEAASEVSAAAEVPEASGQAPVKPADENAGSQAKHPAHIFAAILIFNVLVSLLELLTHVSFLLLVSMTVIPFAFLWSLLIGQGLSFIRRARTRLPEQVLRMQDQFLVYLSAGFMITAIQSTGAGRVLNSGLGTFKDAIGADLFLLFIPLIPLGLAFVGLHPAVGLALAAESLDPAALGISPQITAIAMLTGAATAFLMGPYNATAGIMAGLINRSPYKVSNWNAPFTAAYLAMSTIVLLILQKGG